MYRQRHASRLLRYDVDAPANVFGALPAKRPESFYMMNDSSSTNNKNDSDIDTDIGNDANNSDNRDSRKLVQ